jgi:hypothetical protein
MAFVTIRIKGSEGYTRVALGKERMVLGRSSQSDVPVKHTSISREHFAFVREGESWLIEDLGSSNGTWINKEKVAGRVALKEKDIIKAGRSRVTFHLGEMVGSEAVIEVSSPGDDDGDPSGPVRTHGENDPPEAIPCGGCGAWFSIAHHLAGDSMPCPRCNQTNTVPNQ